MNSSSDSLLGIVELARRLNVSVPTLRRWLDQGRLPEPIRFRRNLFISRLDQVQHLLDERTSPAAAAC